MQCKLNMPQNYSVEWIASFSDDNFEKLNYKKINMDCIFDVNTDRNGILVSYNDNDGSYIGAYPLQKNIEIK